MSDSKGLYAVPENIRKMKPRGTMVKKIKGHYYVYRMQHIKDEKTGKWKIKSLGIIGKIVEGRGFIQNTEDDSTVCEYGTYCLFEECASDIRTLFFKAFGNGDDALRIWDCGMIYAVNGFRPISLMSHFFQTSCYSLAHPDIKVGETAIGNMLEKLGRRDVEAKDFQKQIGRASCRERV